MPLKNTSRNKAPVRRTPNDYEAGPLPQWAKNLENQMKAHGGYNPHRTVPGSKLHRRFADGQRKIDDFKRRSRNQQWAKDYTIRKR